MQVNERRALRDSAERFFAAQCGFARHRERQAAGDGLDRALWTQFADMGWLGVALPEEAGGLGQRWGDALTVVEAAGHAFVAAPYAETQAAAHLLLALGSAEQRDRLLPGLCDGSAVTLPAHAEHGARYDLHCVQARGTRVPGGFRLDGVKAAVPFGASADHLLVSARTSGALADAAGISLFVVDARAPGLSFVPLTDIEGHPCADVRLDGVVVSEDALIGPEGGSGEAIESAKQLLLAAACAEAVGTLKAALDATREYAGTRRQFGQALSGFQVIAHRLVDMFTQVELSRSMAALAAQLVDADVPAADRRLKLSACKARISAACRFVSESAVHIHGGIGMTDELALSHQARRLLAIERRCGDHFHHLGQLSNAVAQGAGLYA